MLLHNNGLFRERDKQVQKHQYVLIHMEISAFKRQLKKWENMYRLRHKMPEWHKPYQPESCGVNVKPMCGLLVLNGCFQCFSMQKNNKKIFTYKVAGYWHVIHHTNKKSLSRFELPHLILWLCNETERQCWHSKLIFLGKCSRMKITSDSDETDA